VSSVENTSAVTLSCSGACCWGVFGLPPRFLYVAIIKYYGCKNKIFIPIRLAAKMFILDAY
jgi:hypothetical protein